MEVLDRVRLIINGDNQLKELIRKTVSEDSNYIQDIYSGTRIIDIYILMALQSMGYSIDWLISGEGSLKRTFVDENILNKYDKIIFNSFFDSILEEKQLDINFVTNTDELDEWEKFAIAKEKSDLVIYNTYVSFLRLSIWKLICKSKYFDFIVNYLIIDKNIRDVDYFSMHVINLIESNITNANLNQSTLKINQELSPENLEKFYHYIACLYYVSYKVNDYTNEIKKYKNKRIDVSIEDMRNFVEKEISEMGNESFLLQKSKRFISIVKETFNIVVVTESK